MKKKIIKLDQPLELEGGQQLENANIAFHSYGDFKKGKKVVWVCHALTANSDVFEWWKGLFGEEDFFNPKDHFIICANIIGSHYGSTGPLSLNLKTGQAYYHDFPELTVRDLVQAHRRLADHLGIEDIDVLVGGSMGGHQALEWAISQPERIKNLAIVASSAVHSPWGVAFNESQRMAIEKDVTWKSNDDQAGIEGLKVARSIALLSYRNFKTYQKTQQPSQNDLLYPDRPATYQIHQGDKLAARFNAFSYWHLSKVMDSHNVGRLRGDVDEALSKVKARTIVVSLEDDVLFPVSDQLRIVNGITNAEHRYIPSFYGHDGFLIETDRLTKIFKGFLNEKDEALEERRYHGKVNQFETGEYADGESTEVGLIGFGHVGRAFYEQTLERHNVNVKGVAVKRKGVDRGKNPPSFIYDPFELIYDTDIQVIVELIDDADAAFEYAKAVLSEGKTLISANKKMLALHLQELKNLEIVYGGRLFYEAAVAGAIPILRNINEYYQSEPIRKIEGIINGSTNYILSKMADEGLAFSDALTEAQEKGFAESDPTLDVEGYDASYKASLLAYSALGQYVHPDNIERIGIAGISTDDIKNAKANNRKIKLVATIENSGSGQIQISVKPQLLGPENDLFHIQNELNAVAVDGLYSARNLFKGSGAGGHPTASAVVADLDFAIKNVEQLIS